MPRSIWRGSISFGLVTIPVSLVLAESPKDLAFHLLDDRDKARIHNRRVNAQTGEEVPTEHIVKGYEIGEGRWVTISDDDLRAANVEATQTIDVVAAVCAEEIAPMYFDKPYYLAPEKAGRKAYGLLRDVLVETKRVALAKIVIRTRQYLAAIVPDGDVLVLELLRYPYELRGTEGIEPPGHVKADKSSETERALAKQLVDAISRPFDPDAAEYRDTYRDDVLALIDRKASGEQVAVTESVPRAAGGEVVDIVALLKASLDEAKRARG
jgi:DNA end-binding protein Ku